MKTLFLKLIIISLFFISTLSNAQSWSHYYPGEGSITGIVDTADENVIVQSTDGTISKISSLNGDIIWTLKVSSNSVANNPQADSYTFQSLTRKGNIILVARHDSWLLLQDNGTTATVLLKKEYGLSPLGSYLDTKVSRVKFIDGYFYIMGGLLYAHPGTPNAIFTKSAFIQKIQATGNNIGDIIWSNTSETSTGTGEPPIVFNQYRPMYTDIEKLNNGDLVASYAFNSWGGVPIAHIDDSTGIDIKTQLIWDTGNNLGGGIMTSDIELSQIGNLEILTVVGNEFGAIGNTGDFLNQDRFRVSTIVGSNIIINATIYDSTQGLPYFSYFDAHNTVDSAGILVEYNNGVGQAKLFANLNGEAVIFDDSFVNYNLYSGFCSMGSHSIYRIGDVYYIGTSSLDSSGLMQTPLLIKKDAGDLFSDFMCVTDLELSVEPLQVVQSIDLLDYQPKPFTMNSVGYITEQGATKETACCTNFPITIFGAGTLCGSGMLTLTASANGSNNTYNWTSNGVFQNTTNPNTIEVYFSDNTIGYFDFCVEVITSDGCISNECVTGKIVPSMYHTLPSQICSSDSCVDFLTTGASSGEFTVNGAGVSTYVLGNIKYYEFCPLGLSSGMYDIEIINNISGCSTIASIEVLDGTWAKSTSNSFSGDVGVDLDSDTNGNVYSLGNFIYETNFENYSLSSLGTGDNNMMLSKIGECGTIDWIATSIEGDQEAVKIDVNENLELIYVTGNYNEITTFLPAKLPDGTLACFYNVNNFLETTNESGVYVVIYNFDGCLIDLIEYPNTPNTEFQVQAVSSHEFDSNGINNRYYLMLREIPLNTGSTDYLRLKAITPNYTTGTTTYSEVENWTQSFSSSVEVQVNDMVNHRNQIYFTGFFKRNLFSLGLSAPVLNSSGNNPDTFIYGINDNNIDAGYIFNKELYTGSPEQHYAVGHGITANNHGVFSTGSYKQSANNAFDSGLFMLSFGVNSNAKTAYVLGLELDGQFKWINSISSKNSIGKAITVTEFGNVYISGSFKGQNMRYQDISAQTSTLPILNANLSNGWHKFIVNWNADDAYNFSGEWANASMSSKQVNTSITTTFDYAYTSGSYLDTMEMLNTAVSPLISSGNGTNLYIMRHDALNGQAKNRENLKKVFIKDDEVTQIIDINLFPNPVKGELTINSVHKLDNITIKIFDIVGNIVFMEKFESLTKNTINLEKIAIGLYIGTIQDSNDAVLKSFKIIKQ